MLPVPFAINSKLLLLFVVLIKLSSTNISPVVKLFDVIVPTLTTSPTVNVPSTVRLFVTIRSLLGISIDPVPLPLSSKSLLDSVVVIILSSIRIFSNWNAQVTSKSPSTFKLPVRSILPVCVVLPV